MSKKADFSMFLASLRADSQTVLASSRQTSLEISSLLFDVDINGVSVLNVFDGRDGFIGLDPFTIKARKKVLKEKTEL